MPFGILSLKGKARKTSCGIPSKIGSGKFLKPNRFSRCVLQTICTINVTPARAEVRKNDRPEARKRHRMPRFGGNGGTGDFKKRQGCVAKNIWGTALEHDSAIDPDDLAGDIPGLIRCQESGQIGDVFRQADLFGGYQFQV